MNAKTVTDMLKKAIDTDKNDCTTTKVVEGGDRNPWAGCNIVTPEGSVLQLRVKRIVKG